MEKIGVDIFDGRYLVIGQCAGLLFPRAPREMSSVLPEESHHQIESVLGHLKKVLERGVDAGLQHAANTDHQLALALAVPRLAA
jgi:hypothetical protein